MPSRLRGGPQLVQARLSNPTNCSLRMSHSHALRSSPRAMASARSSMASMLMPEGRWPRPPSVSRDPPAEVPKPTALPTARSWSREEPTLASSRTSAACPRGWMPGRAAALSPGWAPGGCAARGGRWLCLHTAIPPLAHLLGRRGAGAAATVSIPSCATARTMAARYPSPFASELDRASC